MTPASYLWAALPGSSVMHAFVLPATSKPATACGKETPWLIPFPRPGDGKRCVDCLRALKIA